MDTQELVRRIDALQYELDTLVKPEYKPGLKFVLADKDGDGDFDPLTSTDWDGDAKNGNGTIDWNADFGVPTYAKAVEIWVAVTDAAVGASLLLKAKATTTKFLFGVRTPAINSTNDNNGTVPIAADGTSYWQANNVDAVYIRVVGWYV